MGGIGSEHHHLAVIALAIALEDFRGGGLTGTVGTEEGEAFADVNLEIDPVDRPQVSVAFA